MPSDTFRETQLTELVAEHIGAAPAALRVSRCRTGKFNTTYFVDGVDVPLVLRIAPPDDPTRMLFYEYRMMRQEPGLHAAIRARTTAPVPEILAHGQNHPRLGRDYLLMRRMSGTPVSEHGGLSRAAVTRALRDVGDALRQVHAIHGEQYGYVGEHRPMEPQADWTGAFVIMWNRLIDDTVRCGGYDEDEAAYMRRLLDRHLGAFDRHEPASLLHMDVWAQNLLVDDAGRLTGLLDWDRALWGDPEIEFAVLDYCGISEPPFWEGYGSRRDTSRAGEVRRIFYLLYEVQKYILIRRVRSGSASAADDYRRQSLRLARQLA